MKPYPLPPPLCLRRCVASDVSADLHEQDELLDGNRQISGDSTAAVDAETGLGSNGSLGDTLGSTAGKPGGVVGGGEQGEVDRKSPVSVVQEYDRKKKLAGDLGNGFVRFNLSPAKASRKGGNGEYPRPTVVYRSTVVYRGCWTKEGLGGGAVNGKALCFGQLVGKNGWIKVSVWHIGRRRASFVAVGE